jgi:hypothetical protein
LGRSWADRQRGSPAMWRSVASLPPRAFRQVVRLRVRLRHHRRNKQRLHKRVADLQGKVETLQEPCSSLPGILPLFSAGAANDSTRGGKVGPYAGGSCVFQGPKLGTMTARMVAHGMGAAMPAVWVAATRYLAAAVLRSGSPSCSGSWTSCGPVVAPLVTIRWAAQRRQCRSVATPGCRCHCLIQVTTPLRAFHGSHGSQYHCGHLPSCPLHNDSPLSSTISARLWQGSLACGTVRALRALCGCQNRVVRDIGQWPRGLASCNMASSLGGGRVCLWWGCLCRLCCSGDVPEVLSAGGVPPGLQAELVSCRRGPPSCGLLTGEELGGAWCAVALELPLAASLALRSPCQPRVPRPALSAGSVCRGLPQPPASSGVYHRQSRSFSQLVAWRRCLAVLDDSLRVSLDSPTS